jgi:hypothetical protein
VGKHTTHDGNVEIIVVSKIYEVSVGSFGGGLTVIVDQAVTERNISLLFSG